MLISPDASSIQPPDKDKGDCADALHQATDKRYDARASWLSFIGGEIRGDDEFAVSRSNGMEYTIKKRTG